MVGLGVGETVGLGRVDGQDVGDTVGLLVGDSVGLNNSDWFGADGLVGELEGLGIGAKVIDVD